MVLSQSKIFHIGFHKTATSSFEIAYQELGLRLFDRLKSKKLLIPYFTSQNPDDLLPIINSYDAFSDNPWFWNDLFLYLDKKFKGKSKFILTYRDPQKWFSSILRKHKNMNRLAVDIVYKGKCPCEENKMHYITTYTSYNKRCIDYFANSSNFLPVNIDKSPNYLELCNFLDLPCPNVNKTFPHANASI